MLLVHGPRSGVYRSAGKTDRRNVWIADKQRRIGTTKACVTVANKNARIISGASRSSRVKYPPLVGQNVVHKHLNIDHVTLPVLVEISTATRAGA